MQRSISTVSIGVALLVALSAGPAWAAEDPVALLARARRLHQSLEYDRVVPLTRRLLEIQNLDIELKLEAYLLQAQCLAIVDDPVEAEPPFRLLLRARPDFDLPEGTPPKILAVFRKVQAEERAILEEVQAFQRRRLVEGLELLGEGPARGRGGVPLRFSFRLRDPTGAVDEVQVPYRRQGERSFSILALQRDSEGRWRGAIAGEWTASAKPFRLEYYVATRDRAGTLLELGSASAPLSIPMDAGKVERSWPRPVPRWAFWSAVVATTLGGLAAGGLGVAALEAQQDHQAYVDLGREQPIEGSLLNEKARRATDLTSGARLALVGAGGLALVTVISLPFVAP